MKPLFSPAVVAAFSVVVLSAVGQAWAQGLPSACRANDLAIMSPQDLDTRLLRDDGVVLRRVRVPETWHGPPAQSRAREFVCEECCFDRGLMITDRQIGPDVDLRATEIRGLIVVQDTLFDGRLLLRRNSRVSGEASFTHATFARGLVLEDVTFEAPVVFSEAVVFGVADIRRSNLEGGLDIVLSDFLGPLHLDESGLSRRVLLQRSSFAGGVSARQASIMSRVRILESKFPGTLDLRFSRIGTCASEQATCVPSEDTPGLEVRESQLDRLCLHRLQSDPSLGPTLTLSGAAFERIEGTGWHELKGLLAPLEGQADADPEARRRAAGGAVATLRQVERSFLDQGQGDDAADVEIFRRGLEADQGGVVDLGLHWFQNVTSRYGHAPWRMPAWCLAWVLTFAALYGTLRTRRPWRTRTSDVKLSIRAFCGASITREDALDRIPPWLLTVESWLGYASIAALGAAFSAAIG